MKTNTRGFKKLLCTPIVVAIFSVAVQAQATRVDLSSVDRLAAKATNSVDVTLDGSMLKIATRGLSQKHSTDDEKVKELLSMLTSVHVRHLEFGNESDISDSDIEPVRAQLQSPGWSKVASVRSRKDGDNVDIFTMSEGNIVKNIVIIVQEPKELTYVNMAGSLDPARLSAVIGELGGKFGIPSIDLGR